MKKIILKRVSAIFVCVALLLTYALPASAAWTEEDYEMSAFVNLLENPGFEDGDWGWELTGDATVEEEAAFDGLYGAFLNGDSTTTIQQQVYFTGPGEYELKLCLNAGARDLFASVIVSLVSATGTQSMTSIYFTNGWQRIAQTLTVTEEQLQDDTFIKIEVSALESPVYIDNMFLARKDDMPPALELDEGENFISNGDFEGGAAGWEPYQKGATISAAGGSYTNSGRGSLKVSTTTGDSHGAAYKLPAGMEEGEYEISAYVYAPAAKAGSKVCAGFQGSLTAWLIFTIPNLSLPISPSDGWVKVSFLAWLTPAEPYYFSVSMNDGSDLYVDDVSVIPTHLALDSQEPEPDPNPDPDPQPQNLLQNPSFETSLSGWTQQGSPTAFATDGQAYSGTQSAYFGYFASAPMQNYIEQTVAAGAGSYAFSAMVKPDATLQGVGCMLMLEALDKNGAVLATVSSPAVSDPAKGWQKTGATLTAPAGTASLRLKIGGIYCTGAFYVDEAALQPA